jgi:acyl transferase domain-containing protein
MAGLTKVILQMQHGQLAPSIHSDEPNPDIEFHESPFYLQHRLSEWESSPAHPRRALVNSFGAGGVNACVILEGYENQTPSCELPSAGPRTFVVSARTRDQLEKQVDQLIEHLRAKPNIDLARLCYTLQTGREAFEERLMTVMSESDELIRRLSEWRSKGRSAEVYRGSLDSGQRSRISSNRAKASMGQQSPAELGARWLTGEEVDWDALYGADKPMRISLPTYPFARERYWASDSPFLAQSAQIPASLHPLVTCNSSTLRETSFTSRLSPAGFYGSDHEVMEEKIFPAAGLLEVACVTGTLVAERRVRKISDIVWLHPVNFRSGVQILRTSLKDAGHGVEYAISSLDDEDEPALHSSGLLTFGDDGHPPGETIPIELLKAKCTKTETGAAFYEAFRQCGFNYGPAFQTVVEIFANDSFALAELRIPEGMKGDSAQFILHPSMIDGALQAIAGLLGRGASVPSVPFALDEIEIFRLLPSSCYVYAEFAGPHEENHTGVRKFNIRLADEDGNVLVKLSNLCVRELGAANASARANILAWK